MAKALLEYGKLLRTLHALRWFTDEAFRRRIGRQLNKGESLNDLRRFIAYANAGKEKYRRHEDQEAQAHCLTLVVNICILSTTWYLQDSAEAHRAEGPRSLRRGHRPHQPRPLRGSEPLRDAPHRRGGRARPGPTAAAAAGQAMKPDELLRRLADGQVANVRFADAQRLAQALGFELDRVRGSHHIYRHPGGQRLNLQSRGGQAKPYQLRQLLELVERHALRLEEEQ